MNMYYFYDEQNILLLRNLFGIFLQIAIPMSLFLFSLENITHILGAKEEEVRQSRG